MIQGLSTADRERITISPELSKGVAEVFPELGGQILLPVADLLQSSEEEAEDFRFFDPLQATDQMAVVVDPFHAVRAILDL